MATTLAGSPEPPDDEEPRKKKNKPPVDDLEQRLRDSSQGLAAATKELEELVNKLKRDFGGDNDAA